MQSVLSHMKRDEMDAEPMFRNLNSATSVIQEGETHSTPVVCSGTNSLLLQLISSDTRSG